MLANMASSNDYILSSLLDHHYRGAEMELRATTPLHQSTVGG